MMNSQDSNMAMNAISMAADLVRQEAQYAIWDIQAKLTKPSVLYRPAIYRNYNDYVVSYSHITVRAKTPELAMAEFDRVWTATVTGNPVPGEVEI